MTPLAELFCQQSARKSVAVLMFLEPQDDLQMYVLNFSTCVQAATISNLKVKNEEEKRGGITTTLRIGYISKRQILQTIIGSLQIKQFSTNVTK